VANRHGNKCSAASGVIFINDDLVEEVTLEVALKQVSAMPNRNDRTTEEKLQELFASWELRVEQARRDDRISTGAEDEFRRAIYSYVGEAVRILATDMSKLTFRLDDAQSIPEVLHEHADWLLGKGKGNADTQ